MRPNRRTCGVRACVCVCTLTELLVQVESEAAAAQAEQPGGLQEQPGGVQCVVSQRVNQEERTHLPSQALWKSWERDRVREVERAERDRERERA